MNYTLHQLQVFLKVAEYQSVTRAAESLHLTQPAVSIQLRNLQNQFAVPLTEVVGRQLYVTDFGREIAVAAQKILQEVEAINYKTIAFQGNLAGRLRLSVVSTAKYVMPYFLADFMRQHPGIDLVMDVTNKTQVVRNLEQNEVDFALVSVLPEQLKLARIELMQNKLFLVRGTRRQGEKDSLHLAGVPWLFREPGSATRRAMEQYLEGQSIEVSKRLELTSNEALKQAAMAGLGYSIMPLIGLKHALQSGDLEILPQKGLPIITHWNLVWRREKKLSPTAKAYMAYLETEKARIIAENFAWFEAY